MSIGCISALSERGFFIEFLIGCTCYKSRIRGMDCSLKLICFFFSNEFDECSLN